MHFTFLSFRLKKNLEIYISFYSVIRIKFLRLIISLGDSGFPVGQMWLDWGIPYLKKYFKVSFILNLLNKIFKINISF